MPHYKITPLDDDVDFNHLPFWDVVIIGAGPAGLAASLTTAHRGLTTLVIEAKARPGGQPELLYGHKRIVDVPGFPGGITGEELSARVYSQAVEAQVQFRFREEMISIEDTTQTERTHPLFEVITSKDTYRCRKVIIACGLLHFPRRLDVLDQLHSKKVHYRIPKIGDYEDQRVAVVGGGDSALDAAVMVLERHGEVDLIIRSQVRGKRETLQRIVECGGNVHTSCEIEAAEFAGDQLRLGLSNGQPLVCDLIIVQIGHLSVRETLQKLDLRLNDDGSIAIDQFFETSRSGIFAAGDVHGDIMLIPVAWAEGIQAAIYAFDEITRPYWLNEKRIRDPTIALIDEKIKQAVRETKRAQRTQLQKD